MPARVHLNLKTALPRRRDVLDSWVVSQILLDSDSNESSQSGVGRENQGYEQWRRQGLMVGEAHLVGEANIFYLKYIIHECGLPTNYLSTAAR